MRIYLPSTLPALAAALAAGEVRGTPLVAFSVTAALREEYGDSDMEELEYAAMSAAADASLLLLAADAQATRRRVVLAAEVTDSAVLLPASGTDVDPAAVTVNQSVPMSRVVSAHVDDEAAAEDIALAVDGAESSRVEGHELMWYATQELRYLVD